MTFEEARQQLNKLAQESFLLASDIAKAEQEFQERFTVIKKEAAKLYEKINHRLNEK